MPYGSGGSSFASSGSSSYNSSKFLPLNNLFEINAKFFAQLRKAA
jgi:hypothetical protein